MKGTNLDGFFVIAPSLIFILLPLNIYLIVVAMLKNVPHRILIRIKDRGWYEIRCQVNGQWNPLMCRMRIIKIRPNTTDHRQTRVHITRDTNIQQSLKTTFPFSPLSFLSYPMLFTENRRTSSLRGSSSATLPLWNFTKDPLWTLQTCRESRYNDRHESRFM